MSGKQQLILFIGFSLLVILVVTKYRAYLLTPILTPGGSTPAPAPSLGPSPALGTPGKGGKVIPKTHVAPGAGPGTGGIGYGTGVAPGYVPPGGLYVA